MDPAALLSLVRRRWLAIAACVLAGVAAASLSTRDAPTVYRTSARLFVHLPSASGIDEALQGVQLSSGLLESYAQIATSRRAASMIVNRLSLRDSPESVRGRLSAHTVPNTLILVISASGANPQSAQRVANAAAAVVVDLVQDLQPTDAPTVRPTVIDTADRPTTPVSPRPRRNLVLGLLLGGGLGVAAALLLEALDRSLRTPEQLTTLIPAPLLAAVPRRRDAKSHTLLTAEDSGTQAAEAYRVLRTSVRFVDLNAPLRSLVVTSPSPGDGKTMTACNLAIALAESGERVVLVDADLRRPSLEEAFGIAKEPGLTSVIVGRSIVSTVLHAVSPNLAVIAAGPLPPNPSEILGSRAMQGVVQQLQGIADIVIFDTPPVVAVTDAAVLATHSDGTMLVVRQAVTNRGQAAEAYRRLDVVGARVVGSVFNAVRSAAEMGDEYQYVRYDNSRETRPRLRRWRPAKLGEPAPGEGLADEKESSTGAR